MNPELQKCRQHYATLPPNVRERTTAKCLLAAIQIAEQLEGRLSITMSTLEVTQATVAALKDKRDAKLDA